MFNNSDVIYIGNFDFDQDNAALNRVLSNLEMIKDEYSCHIFGFSKFSGEKNKNNIRYVSVDKPNSIIQWIRYAFCLPQFQKSKIQNNYIILYNLPSLISFMILLKYKTKNIIIADVTEWYEPRGNFITKLIKKIDIYLRMHFINKKMAGLIVISSYLKDFYNQTKHQILIPPLVNFTNTPQFNIRISDKINYIYTGFPGRGKDRLDLILIAFDNILKENSYLNDKIRINILGVTKMELVTSFPNLESILEDMSTIVYFHGRTTHQTSLDYLKDSDYSLIIRDPSIRNNAGFPTKFSESLTLGIPVIYSNFSDIKNYATNNDLFVENVTIESIKKAIYESINRGKTKTKKINETLTTKNIKYNDLFNQFLIDILNNRL